MKKIIFLGVLCLVLISCVSAYYCIYEEDNEEVKNFKSKINMIALHNDLDNGLTPEAIYFKLKYFSPCNK